MASVNESTWTEQAMRALERPGRRRCRARAADQVKGRPTLGRWTWAALKRVTENLVGNAVKYGWRGTTFVVDIPLDGRLRPDASTLA